MVPKVFASAWMNRGVRKVSMRRKRIERICQADMGKQRGKVPE
jgi:hypothetical protein